MNTPRRFESLVEEVKHFDEIFHRSENYVYVDIDLPNGEQFTPTLENIFSQ
jgi:hypothetical protein